jgi:hypothetical protein
VSTLALQCSAVVEYKVDRARETLGPELSQRGELDIVSGTGREVETAAPRSCLRTVRDATQNRIFAL